MKPESHISDRSVVLFRLGEACNNACPFCSNNGSAAAQLIAGDELLVRVDRLARGGVRRVVVTGGEPTIHPAFWDVAERLRARGMRWDINTHGRRFAEPGFVTRAVALGLRRGIISLHHHEPSASARLFGAKLTAHHETVRGITAALRGGVKVMVNCVVTTGSRHQLMDFMDDCVDRFAGTGPFAVKFAFPATTGKGGAWPGIQLRYEELHAEVMAVDRHRDRWPVPVYFEGFPNCIIGREDMSPMSRTGFGETHYLDDVGGRQLFAMEDVEAGFALFPECCQPCSARGRCSGVAKSYAALHGTDELRPFKAPAKARRELALAAEELQRRPGIAVGDPPGGLADRYLVERVLARSGTGTVALARDRQTDTQVAIKSLNVAASEQRRGRFGREAQILREVSHPSLLQGFDLLDIDGQLHLVMEYVNGPTLRRWLATERPGVGLIAARVGDVARGLAALHASGVIHGDVKPANIVVQPVRGAMLVDYGVARRVMPHVGDGRDPAAATASGVLGTPRYMAPEVRGGGAVGFEADVYALGLTLLGALAGVQCAQPPGVDDPLLTIGAVAMPQRMRQCVELALAVDPQLRPTAEQMARALDELQDGELVRDPVGVAHSAEVTAELSVPAIWVSDRGQTIRLLDGAVLQLARRPVMGRVFEVLLAARRERRGEYLELDAVVAAAWPAGVDAGTRDWQCNRVLASLEKLRQAGLGPFLEDDERGFRLSPTIEFLGT